MIILLEGIDASGKSGQAHWLSEKLGAKLFEFPNYNTATGQLIRAHLQKRWYADWAGAAPNATEPVDKILDAMVFQALQTLNRLEMVAEIEDAAVQGDVVLARYWPSAYVYGVLDGLQPEWLLRIHERLPQPDLLLLLDIDAAESFKRRPNGRDRLEADRNRLDRCARLYRALWAQKPYSGLGGDKCAWEIIDGFGTAAEVGERIDLLVDHHGENIP